MEWLINRISFTALEEEQTHKMNFILTDNSKMEKRMDISEELIYKVNFIKKNGEMD